MAMLFLVFLVAMIVIFIGRRNIAMVLIIVNLFLCLAVFIHHITQVLPVNL